MPDREIDAAKHRAEMDEAFHQSITAETAGQFERANRPDNVKVALTTRFPRVGK